MESNTYQCSTNTSNITVTLEDKDLWNRFNDLTNEMILTRDGRGLFPQIRVRIHGLQEHEMYTVQVQFNQVDGQKYQFFNGQWQTNSKRNKSQTNDARLRQIDYKHHDSPNYGNYWTKEIVEFTKLKLTNNEDIKTDKSIYLKSLYKYNAFLQIFKHYKNGLNNADDKILVYSYEFVETEFIAVTAYHNDKIKALKIEHNRFAKSAESRKKKKISSDILSSKFIQNHQQQNFIPILPQPMASSMIPNSSHKWQHNNYINTTTSLATAAVDARNLVYYDDKTNYMQQSSNYVSNLQSQNNLVYDYQLDLDWLSNICDSLTSENPTTFNQ